MGRKKLVRQSIDDIFNTVSRMFVPESILNDFEIYDAENRNGNWVVELREKEGRIPKEIEKELVVLDGYCDPIEILSHGFSAGPVYLKIYRRRYKKSNDDKHYSNKYDLTLKGMKLVPELGIFLKEGDRRLPR
ncbi:MAG: hypothetical protein Q8M23_08755 [Bacteroidales bacterium]|nr:hypothetical protein [Bacteroidales bacterium]